MTETHYSNWPCAGEPADDSEFDRYIKSMPGGQYVGDAWRDEPLEAVAVQVDESVWATNVIADAFPPHLVGPRRFVFVVPRTAAQCLFWYAEEGTHTAESLEIPEWADDLAQFARLVAVAASDLLPHEYIHDAVDLLDTVHTAAEDAGVDPASACAVAAALAGASWEEGIHRLAAAAISVVAETSTVG
jgi:hypothetical protein